MTELTLAEEFMLVVLDDEDGGGKHGFRVHFAVAGAVLAELVLAGRVELADDTLRALDPTPTGTPHLDAALAKIAADPGIKASRVLHGHGNAAVDGVTADLVERGVLREEKKRKLGVVPVRSFPTVDGSAEERVRARLTEVALAGAQPDGRTAALIALLVPLRLWNKAFPDGAGQAKPRLKEIAEGSAVHPSVRRIAELVQRAVRALAGGVA